MFNNFNMSKESWGNLAQLDRESINEDLVSRNAGKVLSDHNKTGKTFESFETESITVTRRSKPKVVTARGMDHAADKARVNKFEYEHEPLFEDVFNLIKLTTGVDPQVRRSISTRKKS